MYADLQRWHLVACVAPIAAAGYYLFSLVQAYRTLPAKVPVHFDLDGRPNGWMNRNLWLVLSPILMGSIIALVFTTQPAPFNLATVMYWCACGLLAGAFLEINRAAQSQQPYKFIPLAIWILMVPACELALSLALKQWWST